VQEVRLEFRLARHSFRFVAVMAGKGGDVFVFLGGGGVVRLREASKDKEGKGKEILRIKANQSTPWDYRFYVARRGLDMLNK
jgi:hypothetical protein